MKKSTIRFYSALLVCAMLAGLLPANAAAGHALADTQAPPGWAKGFRQAAQSTQSVQAAADREAVEIASADELAAAVAEQQAGQTWKLAPGVYELTHGHLAQYAHWDEPGQGGWYFPLHADGLTILGQGEVVITSAVESANGAWASQDFVSVWGDGITIDGVDFRSKSEPNKAIEVMGRDFTLKNCTLLPVVHPDGENGEVFSGSIYFHPANEQADLGRSVLENVYLHAYISASAARAGTLDVRNVTMDARNNIWRVWGTGYGPGLVGSVYGQVEQVRYLVDEHAVLSDILDAGSAYAADTKPGTTIEFSAGTYRLDGLNIGQDVALVGAGSGLTVFQAAAEPAVLIQVAGGDVDFAMSGIHVKGVEHNSHNNTSAVQVGSNGSPSAGNIEITACRFSGFTKNSVTIKGGNARIADNVIDCQPYPGAAGNGIQIDLGAQAVVTGNMVNGYVSQAQNWSACGVLVLRGGKITRIRDNTVTDCQTGIVKETYYDADGDETYLDPEAAKQNVFVGCGQDVDFEFDLAAEIAAYTGGVIVLPCDVALDARLVIDKNVVLDGNGFTIDGPGIEVTAGALTLRDVTLAGSGGKAAVLSLDGTAGGVAAALSGVTILGAQTGGDTAVHITGSADVEMTDCVIGQVRRGVHVDGSGDGGAHSVTVDIRDTELAAADEAVLISDRPGADGTAMVHISSGSFIGALKVADGTGGSALQITGGQFSADPTEYVASGCRVSVSGGLYIVSSGAPGGSTPEPPAPPALPQPSPPETSGGNTTVSTQVQPTVSGDTSRAEVDTGVMDQAVDSVLQAAAENNTAPVIEIVVDSGSANQVEVLLPVSALDTLGRHESAVLTVASGVATVTLDSGAITAVASQAQGHKITLAVAPVAPQSLNEKQQAAAGDAPVFDLHLKSDDTAIAHFGEGQATVSLPHALPAEQTADGVAVYYLDDQGNTTLRGTSYDAEAQKVTFTTPHFSLYMVGYKAPRPAGNPFLDVAETDYFYDAVQWAVQQGIALGTSETAFSPGAPCTRAQIVTLLWRYSGQVPARSRGFADVPQGAYYHDAVQWAAQQGIALGTSQTAFSPDALCTRAQAVTFLFRYAER